MVATALMLGLTAVHVPPAVATDLPVTVFNYPGLNGGTTGADVYDCNNENTNLLSIIDVLDGYSVDGSILDFESSEDPTQDFGTLLDASRFFVMTDMEDASPSDPTFFPETAQTKLESWVDEGGVLVMTGTSGEDDVDFLNLVFGWDLVRTNDDPWSKQAAASGTPFESIDAETLPDLSATDALGKGTVENFRAIWGTEDNATVAVIRYGNGYVIALGFDFFDTGGSGSTYRPEQDACDENDSVWVTGVLPAALAYATQLSDSRLSNISQTSARFTYAFESSGTTYVLLVPSGSAAPTAEQVKAGVDYGEVTVLSAQNAATTADTDESFDLTGLSASTNYVIYVVTEYDVEGTPTLSGVSSASFSTIGEDEEVRGSGPSSPTPTPAPTPAPAPTSSPVSDPEGGLPVVTPPGSTSGSVGGVPSAPTPSVPTSGTAKYEVGVVQAEVRTGGAGTVSGPSSAPVLQVVRDRVATVGGGGMAPGGIVEVWMPLPGGGSRQVALLPVGEDGSFDGALPFTGELDGNGPLPIGERTIQLFGTDANGQLTVVNVGIRVEQPGPLAPEPERSPGAPPTLTPGQSLATNAGLPTPVTVTPLPGERTTRVQGDGWLLEIDVPEGTVRDEAGAPIMEVVAGDDTEVRGTGFLPGTRAYVWIMSDPTFLGEVRIGSDGTFSGALPVDVAPGQHTLQVSGVGTDGYVRAANLGVIVLAGDGAPRPSRIRAGGGADPVVPLETPGVLLALVAGLVTARRMRRTGA